MVNHPCFTKSASLFSIKFQNYWGSFNLSINRQSNLNSININRQSNFIINLMTTSLQTPNLSPFIANRTRSRHKAEIRTIVWSENVNRSTEPSVLSKLQESVNRIDSKMD